MKLSYLWLKDYIELTEAPAVVADLLTRHTAEVEHVELPGKKLDNVVVAEVIAVQHHPQADKLHIGQFDVGGPHLRQIIFGGKALLNIGDKLPVALPGATISGSTITQRKLRGQMSQGMCCLNSELGILDCADVVHNFATVVANGTPIAEALQLNDAIITIDNKTLTHRPDLFNHIGFARELSVILKRPLKIPALIEQAEAKRLPFSVMIDDYQECRRYLGVALDQVTVQPSPPWLQQRLQAIGLRPINNVVDITNYVMHEYGQPLHAFDYDRLSGHLIHVRWANDQEQLTTLDGKKRVLDPRVLVIADDSRAAAIAGIMGGADSEITATTTRLVLESANFNPTTIRLGAQRLGLRTDGSTRHEKNLPMLFPQLGFWRALELLQELTGAQVASAINDSQGVVKPVAPILLDVAYVRRLIGMEIALSQITSILEGLGCTITTTKNTGVLSVIAPAHRTDLTTQEECIEEVARMHGYDRIPQLPLLVALTPPVVEPVFAAGQQLLHWLTGWGAQEVYNYSFYGADDVGALGLQLSDHIELLNPISPQHQYLRQTLLVHLLRNLALNFHNHYQDLTLVEYGHIYLAKGEQRCIAGVVSAEADSSFYRAKGYVEAVLRAANIPAVATAQSSSSVVYHCSTERIATVADVSLPILQHYGITRPVSWLAFDVAAVAQYQTTKFQFQPISSYPKISLDISLAVPETVRWETLEHTIRRYGKGLVQAVSLFDSYRGPDLASHYQAFGIRFILQSSDRTLTMEEAERIRKNIISQLSKQYKAQHRY